MAIAAVGGPNPVTLSTHCHDLQGVWFHFITAAKGPCMFGWRKKKDGFVWNEYVRTTVLLRREQRRQRVEDVRDAAVDGVKQAGRQGVALSVAGASAAGRGIWDGLSFAVTSVVDWVIVAGDATWIWICDRAGPRGIDLGQRFAYLKRFVSAPSLATPLLVTGAIAGASAVTRWTEHGLDAPTAVIAGVAFAALLLATVPTLASWTFGERAGRVFAKVPGPNGVGNRARSLGSLARIGAIVAAGVGAVSWMVPSLMSQSGNTAAFLPDAVSVPASGLIEGRARVMSGDRLIIEGELIRLSGIEAPEAGQLCGSSKSCASGAKSALQKLTNGKRVTCEVSARMADGTSAAKCLVAGADIAGQLVRGGSVFATTGLFATYASAEREAKSARAGLWRSDPLRPDEHRAKTWATAKSAAPDGCPIKGIVVGEIKSYVLPWSGAYEKTKVRAERGERWFCSETEAVSAGWKARETG